MRYQAEFDSPDGTTQHRLETDDLADVMMNCIHNRVTARVYRCRVPEEWGTRYLAFCVHWSGKVTIANR